MWKKIAGAALTIALAAGIAVSQSAQADPQTGPKADDPCHFLSKDRVEVCFSDPANDDPRIYDSIRALTETAGKGDTIRISMYTWLHGDAAEKLAKAVVGAHERQADVSVVLDKATEDKGDPSPSQKILQDGGVPTTVCRIGKAAGDNRDDCLLRRDADYHEPDSPMPMNHVKLFSFRIDGVRSVVTGSTNVNKANYEKAWNDMVRLRGDDQIGKWADGWVDRMAADDWKGWDTADERAAIGADVAKGQLPERMWAYPRPEGGDNIAGQLSKVSGCKSGGENRVEIAISKWTNSSQRKNILKELDEIQSLGCKVKVVADTGIKSEQIERLRDRLGKDNVTRLGGVHHKFILVDAQYKEGGAVSERPFVMTGSQIFTGGSIWHNGEVNIRVGGNDGSKGVADQYSQHFDELLAQAG